MEGKVTVDSDLLRNQAPLTYKYCIYSSQKDEENGSPYEFLHGAPGYLSWSHKVIDRKIVIHTRNFVAKGTLAGLHAACIHVYTIRTHVQV